MSEFLAAAAQSGSFMPHGMCYLWAPDLLWLHVISDGLTGLAYWAIPPFLVYLVIKGRREIPAGAPYAERRLPYDWMFVAFGVFIVACGAVHMMAIWTVWEPRYWLSGGVKAVTALASVATAVALPPLIPRALDLVREARDSELRRVQLEEAHDELEGLYEEQKRIEQERIHFFANVSHELRTPLTLILGPTEKLLQEGQLPEDARRQLEVVVRNARTLRGQVDDLLAVSKLEEGRPAPRPAEVDLSELFRDVAAHFEGQARDQGIRFELEAPEVFPARLDPEMSRRILLNLLSNAFEFTPEGGEIRCSLAEGDGTPEGREEEEDRTGGEVILRVDDSGPGVPAGRREEIFERFRTEETVAGRRFGGTGIGLSVVRQFAELQGGSVSAGDSPLGGARFTVRLPHDLREGPAREAAAPEERDRDRDASPRETESPSSGEGPPRERQTEAEGDVPSVDSGRAPGGSEVGEGPRGFRGAPAGADVLVVEDNPDMASYLADLLREDYRVALARDGEEGLEAATRLRPDLIVTDIMMPRMSGEEMIRRLRRRPELEDVPVLVLTARKEDDLPQKLLRTGAQDYVVKPVSEGELRARVDNLLDLTRSRSVLRDELAVEGNSLEELARAAAERKRALERTVEEKNVLLQELHHRVKGNLQTVSSLLNLQLENMKDEAGREALRESRSRIAAMGLLHEKLYDSGAPDRLDVSTYLDDLVRQVARTRLPAGSPMRMVVESDPVELPVESAVACGLIVHELVTNAIRHAFPDEKEGTVEVRLGPGGEEGGLSLTVRDDGKGMPEDPGAAGEGLGLELVRSLVGQLEGSLSIRREEDTRIQITFPREGGGERGQPS